MPKNNNQTGMKSNVRSKSTARKPLRDVSNAGKSSSKSTAMKVSKSYKEERGAKAGDENGALDRLLLIHSDISSLINQIDELVVQALSLTCRKATKEVESFANFLSEMQSSLKPWIPRFQKVLFDLSPEPENLLEQSVASEVSPVNETVNHVKSPEQTTMVSLVSPSPLVSWKADCNIERSRQLFLLTPLPRSKELSFEYDEKSKSMLKNVTSRKSVQPPIIFDVVGKMNDSFLEGISAKPTPCKTSDCNLETKCVSPESSLKRASWMLGMTPRLKISPPKSCVVLEPISEITKKGGHAVYKSTPFPVGVEISEGSEDSESSSSKVSEHTYLNFLGIKFGQDYVSRRKVVEESPNWLMSPPKSCILMEPPDDKISSSAHIDEPLTKGASILHEGILLPSEKENDIMKQVRSIINQGDSCTKITIKQAGLGTSSIMVECTPMLKEPESTILRGKHPGETTLKKELWMKFEAASTNGIGLTTQKGFLDRLDEL